jgi:hypothetical protein
MKKYLVIYHSIKKDWMYNNFVMGFGPIFYSFDKYTSKYL